MIRRPPSLTPFPYPTLFRSTVPPLDVHKGGYIGLDATPFERLSGCLMHVNQSDSRLAICLAPEKQADLDRLCKQYQLRWRKRRTKDGAIVKHDVTMITQSYNQFKRLYENAAKVPAFRRTWTCISPDTPSSTHGWRLWTICARAPSRRAAPRVREQGRDVRRSGLQAARRWTAR